MDRRSGSGSRHVGSAVSWRPAVNGYSRNGSPRRLHVHLRAARRVIVHHLGLALGGRPGQSFARRLLLPVSKDTLLRVVRRRAALPTEAPRVVGIDDWAFKRGQRYGTIICDLERCRIVSLLPDREAATVAAWLAARPSIEVIARDRGAGYIQAATDGRPNAIQVADRWHLMENASAAFLTVVQRSMQAIRKAVGSDVIDPTVLSCAERRQHSGWLRREEENTAILGLVKQGVAIKEIVRLTGKSRGLVRAILHNSLGERSQQAGRRIDDPRFQLSARSMLDHAVTGSGTRPAVRNTVSLARHLAAERPAPDVRHMLPADRTAQRSPASLASRRGHGGCPQWPWPLGPSSTNWHSCSASPRKRTPPRLSSVHDNETEGPALSPDRIVTRGHRRTRQPPPHTAHPAVTRPNVRGPNVVAAPSIQRRFPALGRGVWQEPTPGTHSASHGANGANQAHPGCA